MNEGTASVSNFSFVWRTQAHFPPPVCVVSSHSTDISTQRYHQYTQCPCWLFILERYKLRCHRLRQRKQKTTAIKNYAMSSKLNASVPGTRKHPNKLDSKNKKKIKKTQKEVKTSRQEFWRVWFKNIQTAARTTYMMKNRYISCKAIGPTGRQDMGTNRATRRK